MKPWPIAMLACVACSTSSPPPPPSPPVTQPPTADPVELARLADSIFDGLQLDYDRPMIDKPHGREWVSQYYLTACRAGDRHSCGIANVLHPSKEAVRILREYCREGDLMSCRLLPSDPYDPFTSLPLPGWAGRVEDCSSEACKRTRKFECMIGLFASCHFQDKREERLAHLNEGCREGSIRECLLLFDHRDPVAGEQFCRLVGGDCFSIDLESTRFASYRDAEEWGCQYGAGSERWRTCDQLAEHYFDRVHEEPVPGRARVLGTWVCRETARRRDPRTAWGRPTVAQELQRCLDEVRVRRYKR